MKMKRKELIKTPKQIAFLAKYNDPKSNTFGNGLQSAIAAGYTEYYGRVLTSLMPDWLYDSIRHSKMLDKAERNLDNYLDLKTEDVSLERIKFDTTKFVAERIGRKVYGQQAGPAVAVQINMNDARKEFVT